MEDRNALAAHDAATALGLEQSLPPSSILRGLPAASQLFATHALGSFSFGSWGWLHLSGGLAALRLCTYPQYGGVRPSGVYLVEVLARLERRQVPACAASPIQLAIRLGEAMDSSEKEDVASATVRPQFELLVLTHGRMAVARHAPEAEYSAGFAEFALVRVTCGSFEIVLPFAPGRALGTEPDITKPPPDEVMSVLGIGNGLRPVPSIAHVSHTPSRWEPPLMERLIGRLSSFSEGRERAATR